MLFHEMDLRRWLQKVQINLITAGRIWVSSPPLSVPITQLAFIEWQCTICRSSPPLKNSDKNQKKQLRWLYKSHQWQVCIPVECITPTCWRILGGWVCIQGENLPREMGSAWRGVDSASKWGGLPGFLPRGICIQGKGSASRGGSAYGGPIPPTPRSAYRSREGGMNPSPFEQYDTHV